MPNTDGVTSKESDPAHASKQAPMSYKPPVVETSSDEEEDADHLLEESPCGRYGKRREQVKQRDVPGIDVAYLAMDNETGHEVVWNEVQFSERKSFRATEDSIRMIFDNLQQLQHTNLVAFHKYWIDMQTEKPRVIFITEYMSSGSMQQFMKRTRKGSRTLSEKVWKKWCTQILSALCYLHSCSPAIVHGNLNCNTIFIQINGLIKIGCVAPNTIHHHVKTVRDAVKNMHYFAPEYELTDVSVTPAADIYAFGVCALEMMLLGFNQPTTSAATAATAAAISATVDAASQPPATAGTQQFVSAETIENSLQALDNPLMKDFLRSCLASNPSDRPTARQLLFHSVLFEVHSLQLLAAHTIVDKGLHESLGVEERSERGANTVLAESHRRRYCVGDLPAFEADKFLEDVRNGIYPLTAFAQPLKSQPQQVAELMTDSTGGGKRMTEETPATSGEEPPAAAVRTASPTVTVDVVEAAAKEKPSDDRIANEPNVADKRVSTGVGNVGVAVKEVVTTEMAPTPATEFPKEKRRIRRMTTELKMLESGLCHMTLTLKLQDGMNRQLSADVGVDDDSKELAGELVTFGFINADDSLNVVQIVQESLRTCRQQHRDNGTTLKQSAAAVSTVTTVDLSTAGGDTKR